MRLFRILYGVIGAALLSGTILTGNSGLSREDKKVYEDAVNLQQEVNKVGFPDFNLKDYKVRFYDGNIDYVVSGSSIEKEDAVFTTFVGTAYEVNGEYQVILPTVENFSEMLQLLDGTERLANGDTDFAEDRYGVEEHIATLWHEALHAYQQTSYESQTASLADKGNISENTGDIISSAVDGNQNVVELYKTQTDTLNRAYEADDQVQKLALVEEYLEQEKERRLLLDETVLAVEDYYEIMEGTARYIESHVYRLQKGTEAFTERYTGRDEYQNGTGKYYESGMLKCYLLDQLKPGWKESYDFSAGLSELLAAL